MESVLCKAGDFIWKMRTNIIVGNLGDSRCIVTKKDQVVFETVDHKPYTPTEEKRIIASGSHVVNKRVEGDLALSRAIGDFQYKEKKDLDPFDQPVSIEADITILERTDDMDYLILACDGVWDALKSEAVANMVNEEIESGKHLQDVIEEIMTFCIHSYDNITLLIIPLKEIPFYEAEEREPPKKEVDSVEISAKEALAPLFAKFEEGEKESVIVEDLDGKEKEKSEEEVVK
eukprot:augustus_masked-scaffold_24-processed-gene-3.49-mRNA-1 protein AED:0.32 eAED:0.32 QI:0/0/0/0.5/1/1/2/0/231